MLSEILIIGATGTTLYFCYREFKAYISQISSNISLLSNNLANPKTRGAWGEEIAKNCLDKIGLKENIDYFCQKTNEEGKRPDFTINVLPGIVCNMDSKFPLNNYMKYFQEGSKEEHLNLFLKDIKDRIKELSSKGYIDPKGGTTDFAICFIPNEQVIEFISSQDPSILELCIEKKVVLCSPWSLYSIISLFSLVRRNVNISNNHKEIIKNINNFEKQWDEFKSAAAQVNKRMESVYAELDNLNGVRTRQLDKSFSKIGT